MIDRKRYQQTFSHVQVSQQTRKKILNMKQAERTHTRRLVRLATAGALAVALSVAAVATFGGTIADWFAREWEARTGSVMSENQTAVIDSLTQTVGQSVTDGDVTVTVDSITVGGESLWVLLEARGLDFDPDENYTFGAMDAEVTPDPGQGQYGGMSYSVGSIGVTGDGSIRLLAEISAVISSGARLDDGEYTLQLLLEDLTAGSIKESEVVYAGQWVFSVPLTADSLSPERFIESVAVTGDVMAPDGSGQGERESREIVLYDLRVTATGVSFYRDGSVEFLMPVQVILDDGTRVEIAGGGGSRLDDGSWYDSFEWPVPIDVSDIAVLCIGETEIPLK